MSHLARPRSLFSVLLLGALASMPVWAAPSSNTPVVIAKAASPALKVVGTSTITVLPGATVADVLTQIIARDGSAQTYSVSDASSNAKSSGAVANGDKLRVTAENGRDTFSYSLAVYDATAKVRDGVYWNEDLYNQIDATVNANLPVFRDVDCVITDPKYSNLVHTVVDGEGSTPTATVWYYGDAIKSAIADCSAGGGGRVVIPADGSRNDPGVYYTGAITLVSNINLYVETGTTVKFVRNPTNVYYPVVLTSREGTDFYNYSPPVYALNATNVAITGGGTFDAQDNVSHWRLPNGIPGALNGSNTVLNNMNYEDVPIAKRIFSDDGHMPATIPVISGNGVIDVPPPSDAVAYKTTFTPNFIEVNHSRNVLLDGFKVRNTIFWQVHPLSSQNILVRNLDVYDDAHHTDDGTDPESCTNVVMEGNNITALDDGVAIKSGRNLNGRKYRDRSENFIVRNNVFFNPSGGSAGISMGSENSGGVKSVFTENNTFGGVGTAYVLKLKMNAYRGGIVEDIYVRNSTVFQTIRGIVNFDTNYSESVPYTRADIFNPTIRNIFLDNVNAAPSVSTTFPAFVTSSAVSRSPIENVYYRNSVFYTTSTFESAFSSLKFFKNLVVQNVKYINPSTHAERLYNTNSTPLNLLDATQAIVGSKTVPLAPATLANPVLINRIPGSTFAVTGKVDLSTYPTFASAGTVKAYLDRGTTAIPVTLSADGTFTTGQMTLDDTVYWYGEPPEYFALVGQPITALQAAPYWYSARHYVAINFYDSGINMNTLVYQVSDRMLGDVNADNALSCADVSAAGAAIGKRAGQAGYVPAADLDQSGVVDIRDISAISRMLPAGTRC